MTNDRPPRVMWLINHTTLRAFELEQFKQRGIEEIFLPKCFPYDEGNLSASITYDEDKNLRISAEDLAILNEQNWYEEPSPAAWEIANRYFDIIVVAFFVRQLIAAVRHFKGGIILRAFGLGGTETYSNLIRQLGGEALESAISRCGKRFFFGIGYEHLAKNEAHILADRAVFLPVGLKDISSNTNNWQGKEHHIFFVCPRIETSPYYNAIYKKFSNNFRGFDYRVGGAQPVAVDNPKVLGFVPRAQHEHHMTQSRCMFYHSQCLNHIHYHPFEAVQAGMPLIFMADGMLDLLGGKHLPGRCATVREARRKIKRMMNDDWRFIMQIRDSQRVLLDVMNPEILGPQWQNGFRKILAEFVIWQSEQIERPLVVRELRRRVAVILPIEYKGGTFRGAKLLAHAIYLGSRQSDEPVDVVFLHLDNTMTYPDEEFADLPYGITRRPFNWKFLPANEARRAMCYAGFENWQPVHDSYIVPDDNIQQLQDCDLWLVVSDRLMRPLLPIKPVVLMVYDYLQRYTNILSHGADQHFLAAAQIAQRVMVTTNFTFNDAVQYAGIEPRRVLKLPILAPIFPLQPAINTEIAMRGNYFLWTTNIAIHKNHQHAIEALRIYYDELAGTLDCCVTGVATKELLTTDFPHLKVMASIFKRSKSLRRRVKMRGELPDAEYRNVLSQAHFLWHAGRIDNGTFCVVEAACCGVPSLSSDYPAMREIDQQFSLNLAWMDPYSSRNMAEQLKYMEETAPQRCTLLPDFEQMNSQRVEALARAYWEGIRKCL